MTIRQIIANFWVQLERETGAIPTRIELPPVAYDKLVTEFNARKPVATARLERGVAPHLVLTHNGQAITVTRTPSPVRCVPTGSK